MLALLGGCEATCGSPEKLADIRLASNRTTVEVPISIDGISGSMIFDTGADGSMLTPKAAERLGLVRTAALARGAGIGGATSVRVAYADKVQVGAGELDGVDFIVADDSRINDRIGNAWGFLGRDLLSYWDLDLDLGHRRMSLYRPQLCSTATPPWSLPYHSFATSVSTSSPAGPLVVPFSVGSTRLAGLVDTGAAGTLVDPRSLAPEQAAALRSRPVSVIGTGARTETGQVGRFSDVAIGPIKEQPIFLVGLPFKNHGFGDDEFDALIGRNLLSRHRVYLAFHAHRVFVSDGPD